MFLIGMNRVLLLNKTNHETTLIGLPSSEIFDLNPHCKNVNWEQ